MHSALLTAQFACFYKPKSQDISALTHENT